MWPDILQSVSQSNVSVCRWKNAYPNGHSQKTLLSYIATIETIPALVYSLVGSMRPLVFMRMFMNINNNVVKKPLFRTDLSIKTGMKTSQNSNNNHLTVVVWGFSS